MKSTIGRPRKLTDRQVEMVLEWRSRYLTWRALGKALMSQRALAREFGVAPATIRYAIRIEGQYKKAAHPRVRSERE